MDIFWKELSKQIGPIPTTVQVALEQTKFVHAGLVYLDDATIECVEADIRRLPVLLNQSEKEVAALLDYKGHIKEFRFLAGERCIIKLIAQKIKESGFQTFFKPQRNATDTSTMLPNVSTDATTTKTSSISTKTTTAVMAPITTTPAIAMAPVIMDTVDAVEEVRAKIYNYYDQRRENFAAEESFFDRLTELEVDVQKDYLGDVARVTCPFCDPQFDLTMMIRRDKSGTWKVSNFSGHIKAKHVDLCIPVTENFAREGARKRPYHESNSSECVEEQLYESSGDGIIKVEL